MKLIKKIKDLKRLASTEEVAEISRRYFVMNSFDGAMTILGIVLGNLASGAVSPRFIIFSGLGASLAMGLSGFVGAYMAEEAERTKQISQLEENLLRSLEDSGIRERATLASVWTAIVDGISPSITAILAISPFFVSLLTPIANVTAAYLSIGLTLFSLFLLGAYLGKISDRNVVLHGLKMLIAGLVMTIVLFFIGHKPNKLITLLRKA